MPSPLTVSPGHPTSKGQRVSVPSADEMLASILAEASEQGAHADRTQAWAAAMAEIQGEGEAAGGQVRVIVDSQGRMAGVELEADVVARGAKAVSAAVQEATRRATQDLVGQVQDATAATFGPDSPTTHAMTADLQRLLDRRPTA